MISSRWQTALLALSLALGGGGAWLGFSNSIRAPGDHCATGGARMHRVELVFGLSRTDRTEIDDRAWEDFLDREVTPRFPDGLTVLAGSGRWRGPAGNATKEPSRLLLIWVKPAADLDQRIGLVRDAWKRIHAQESVLRADGVSCVSF